MNFKKLLNSGRKHALPFGAGVAVGILASPIIKVGFNKLADKISAVQKDYKDDEKQNKHIEYNVPNIMAIER